MGLFKVVMMEIDVHKYSDLRKQFVRLRHLKCNVARAGCRSRLKSISICTFVMAFFLPLMCTLAIIVSRLERR